MDGHRASYCQYFLEVFIKRFDRVYVVTNQGQMTASVKSMLAPFLKTGKVEIIEIEGGLKITAEVFLGLQNKLKADLTVIQEADYHLSIINQQFKKGRKRFRGKTIGIFLRSPNYIYREQLVGKRWVYWWNELRRLKRLFRHWDIDSHLFHEFLLPKYHLLDHAICLDEYFVKQHGPPHIWMPDIYFAMDEATSRFDGEECARYQETLDRFLAVNQGREIFFYFGGAEVRKGYDTLLRLAVEEQGCFIHCGMNIDAFGQYPHDVIELKEILSSENRFYAIDEFLLSHSAVEMFFKKIQYLILPYRRHLGSSGAMLLALSYGKPVLVPDIGLMARRVMDHSLGMVYQHENYQDLKKRVQDIKSVLPGRYEPAIQEFMATFTDEKRLAFIDQILSDFPSQGF